jgi:hypothetical protein
MDKDRLSAYIVISLDVLEESALHLEEEGEYNSSFRKMLDVANEYIAAELTPVVLWNIEDNSLYCIVKELVGKKLH